MKKAIIGLVVLAALIALVAYNVWRANEEPVTAPPTMVEIGREQLHEQLVKSKAREAEIERQDWNSIPLLRQLIQAHQHRIEQLSGNSQAGEIVAHDREAMARLEKRIADLAAAAAAQSASPETSNPDAATQSPAASAPASPVSPALSHP